MKKSISSFFKILLCVILMLNLTGCMGATEISDVPLVLGVGIDKGTGPEKFMIIAQIAKSEQLGQSPNGGGGGGGGSSEPAFINLVRSADTLFYAFRSLTKMTGNRVFLGHAEVYLFGKDLAREGMQDYIDFLMRVPDVRPAANMFIVDGTAKELLDLKPLIEDMPAINIKNLIKTVRFTSESKEVTLNEFSHDLMSKTTSPVAPVVCIAENGGNKTACVSGLAVFKNYKMVGTFDDKEARGLLWVTNEIKRGIINIPEENGNGKIALEILNSKSSLKPELKDGKILMHIKIDTRASLSEQPADVDFISLKGQEYLKKAYEAAIKDEIYSAFEKSKKLKVDPYRFGEYISFKYPKEWKDMAQNWDKLFPEIEFVLDIKTKITKTDELTNSVSPNSVKKRRTKDEA